MRGGLSPARASLGVARGPRIELAGGIHHVTARTPSGRVLYRDDEDRRIYLRLLRKEAADYSWQVLTWCLMTNHVHLLVRTPSGNLGRGMKPLHEAFATFFNRKYDEHGHLFAQRFANKLVRDDAHLFGCFRYIARNPVAAGLCDSPVDWPWSAHAALAGSRPPLPPLDVGAALSYFGPDFAPARNAYLRLTAMDDRELLTALERRSRSGRWLSEAVDDFAIPVGAISAHLGVSRRRTYERLANARAH